jgi:hypothetical protein
MGISWDNNNPIVIDIDGLIKGEYNYSLIVSDQKGNQAVDTVIVSVIDSTDPEIVSVPNDLTYSEGTIGHTISWNSTDIYADNYVIYQNGTPTGEIGNWTNSGNITINVEGLNKGVYNYTLIVYDESNNFAQSSVMIRVIDTTKPEFSFIPNDLVYTEDSIGNTLSWNSTDNYAESYELYQNGTHLWDSGSWSIANNITINVDGLVKGNYNFTLYIYDTSNNIQTDSVFILVIDTTNPEVLQKSGDIIYPVGFNENYIWWNASDNYPGIYYVYLELQVYTIGTWDDKEIILIDVDGLLTGTYNFVISFYDESNNYVNSTIIVTVIEENTPPELTSTPSALIFLEGSSGNTLTWGATDDFPFIYRLYINGLNTELNLWSNFVPITINFDNLDVGENNVTIVIQDLSRNSVTHTAFVTVIDNIAPALSGTIASSLYIVGTENNILEWNVTDKHPWIFELYQDGILILSADWSEIATITVNIDGLQIGYYNFSIIIYDESMNSLIDTVYVDVTFIKTYTQYVSPATDMYEGHIDHISGLWLTEAEELIALGFISASIYSGTDHNTELRRFNSLVVNGGFSLIINYEGIMPGNYILKLNFEQGSYENITLSYDIIIYPHQLKVQYEFPDELISGTNFTIEVRVFYNDSDNSILNLNQLGGADGPVEALEVEIIIKLLYRNGTHNTIDFFDRTDFNGYMLVTLRAEETLNLLKIDSIIASIESQGAYAETNVMVPLDDIPAVVSFTIQRDNHVDVPLIGSIDLSTLILAIIIILISIILFVTYKYRLYSQIKIIRISEVVSNANSEIDGLQSIKQVLLINRAGLPLYIRQIQAITLDPLLLSGMSSAISSFLQEVSKQEFYGMQILENQGLSITSHKTELSTLIVISTEGLPPMILNQITTSHPTIEERCVDILSKNRPSLIDTNLIEDIFTSCDFKISLVIEKLEINEGKLRKIYRTVDRTLRNDQKLFISLLIASVGRNKMQYFLHELYEYCKTNKLPLNKIASNILKAYNEGILEINRDDF